MALIYIDMDDCIADFTASKAFDYGFDVSLMYDKGFFAELPAVDGALVAVRQIMKMGHQVEILSQPVAESAHSYSEKVEWIGHYFPELITKINFTQNKGNFKGDYLIDDNHGKWKTLFEANGGKFIHFNYHAGKEEHRNQWQKIVKFLRSQSL